MNFGEALKHLKNGERVARAGWNGKNMFIWLEKGNIPADARDHYSQEPFFESRPVEPGDELYGEEHAVVLMRNGISHICFQLGDNGTAVRLPHLSMRAANGDTVTGWLASQTDMLAEDWEIV